MNDAAPTRRRKASVDQVLVYADGPQLISLSGSRNSSWLGVAVEATGFDYPFFCVQVTQEDLQNYYDGHVDLRYLYIYTKRRDYMMFDYQNYEGGEIYLLPAKLDEAYLPEEGFFSRDHTEEVIQSARGSFPTQRNANAYVVEVDGSWEFPEFGIFGDKMSAVYSFLHSISGIALGGRAFADLAYQKRLEQAFADHPWQGGFSYVHFYDDLYRNIPRRDRLNVERFQYASPGTIKLNGNPQVFDDVRKALGAISKNRDKAGDNYHNLYYFLSKNKLLAASKETVRGASTIQGVVQESVTALSSTIALDHLATIHDLSEKNWIITAKIVLSYYRRLSDLFQFFAEGRAKQRLLQP